VRLIRERRELDGVLLQVHWILHCSSLLVFLSGHLPRTAIVWRWGRHLHAIRASVYLAVRS
jgi:hypothetical protein